MPLLQMRQVVKRFPGVLAVDHVDLHVPEGRVVGLIGENGAGKSTLIKMIAGVFPPDEGSMEWNGGPVQFDSPAQAMRAGIAVIHQEFNLIPQLTVAQNMFLGHEPASDLAPLDQREMNTRAERKLNRVGLSVDPRTRVSRLSVAQKQLVEIAKALTVDARLLIMDEPTAALADQEVKGLFALIRGFRAEGRSVIFISHRLEEVFQICDEVVVMRDGRRVGTGRARELTMADAVRLMTGKEIGAEQRMNPRPHGVPVLTVRDLTLAGSYSGVSFDLHKGEVVAFAGLEGQGHRELIQTLFGLWPAYAGEIRRDGKPVRLTSPQSAMRARIAFVPEERKAEGICLHRSVRENVALATLAQRQRLGIVAKRAEGALVTQLVQRLRVVTPSVRKLAKDLSGGNQQKVVLAKWMAARPDVLLMIEPTRGVDIAAKEDIYALIEDLAGAGTGILLITSDMLELLRLADRILVMHDGRLVGEFIAGRVTKQQIMEAQWGFPPNPTTVEVES